VRFQARSPRRHGPPTTPLLGRRRKRENKVLYFHKQIIMFVKKQKEILGGRRFTASVNFSALYFGLPTKKVPCRPSPRRRQQTNVTLRSCEKLCICFPVVPAPLWWVYEALQSCGCGSGFCCVCSDGTVQLRLPFRPIRGGGCAAKAPDTEYGFLIVSPYRTGAVITVGAMWARCDAGRVWVASDIDNAAASVAQHR